MSQLNSSNSTSGAYGITAVKSNYF